MATKEPESWITVNGKHIPIGAGESKQDAINRALKNKDEDTKQKQIKQNEEEAKKLNDQHKDDNKDPRVPTAEDWDKEAARQGVNVTADDIEDYVGSSYGNTQLGDKISKVIDNAPDKMKVGDAEIYRGLSFNSKQEMDNFLNQQIIKSTRDGLSWTKDNNVAKTFATEDSKYSVVLVNQDDNKNAIAIHDFAETPVPSKEVLYSSTTDFEIEDTEVRGGVTYVYVTEAAFSQRKYK